MWWDELLHNQILLCALCAWGLAQLIKTVLYAILNHELDWGRLMGDGGMPSGHSATVTALAIRTGIETGFSSPMFAVTAVLAVIVMHDASGVRMEAGKHAKSLNMLWEELAERMDLRLHRPEEALKEFVGHTHLQVFCGALLGAGLAVLMGES